MKLMFAPDIHGSLPAMERILERFVANGTQWLVILGDVLNHGPYNALPEGYASAQVAGRLNELTSRTIAVRGNCDSEVDQMFPYFPMTAPRQQILTENQRLFLTHEHLFGPQNMPTLNAGDVLVHGHTHLPVAERREDIYHFNPGSISIPRGGFAASHGILDNNVLSVMALNDQSVIAQVEINPQFTPQTWTRRKSTRKKKVS